MGTLLRPFLSRRPSGASGMNPVLDSKAQFYHYPVYDLGEGPHTMNLGIPKHARN